MSTTTLEIDAPQIRATQLTARPGTLPTLVIPMTRSAQVDVEGIWHYLREPAEFFGLRMPGPDEVRAAVGVFTTAFDDDTTVIAASITIAETDGAPQILLTGSPVQPMRTDAVRVSGGHALRPLHRATDEWWRRMAARTTSMADADQCERWLNSQGFADAIPGGVPILGALVVEVEDGIVGVENSEPTSVLEQLTQCGVIAGIDRVPECPTGARRAWWLSPRYQTHPVAELDGTQLTVEADAVPPFARWS